MIVEDLSFSFLTQAPSSLDLNRSAGVFWAKAVMPDSSMRSMIERTDLNLEIIILIIYEQVGDFNHRLPDRVAVKLSKVVFQH